VLLIELAQLLYFDCVKYDLESWLVMYAQDILQENVLPNFKLRRKRFPEKHKLKANLRWVGSIAFK